MDPTANASTVLALTEFAIRTRICDETIEREIDEDAADYFKRYPEAQIYRTVHGNPERYPRCVEHKSVSLCDANAGDLKTVRNLLEVDTHLATQMSFEQLLAMHAEQCPEQPAIKALATRPRGRGDRVPTECKSAWLRPILESVTVRLQSDDPSGPSNCSSEAWRYLEAHCNAHERARYPRRGAAPRGVPPVFGVESYLCPFTHSPWRPAAHP
jgi:hypothetical protein